MSTPSAGFAPNPFVRAAHAFSRRRRAERAELFRMAVRLDERTRILDLGSEDGSHIHSVLAGTAVPPGNVFIADSDAAAVTRGATQFGYQPVVIGELSRLPFDDGHFDVVYCSSVIEHVTVPQSQVWSIRSGTDFRRLAAERQAELAREIMRVGKQYFVQTPHRGFPVESHCWLPMGGYLPRRVLMPLLAVSNRAWIKRTAPDCRLLDEGEMGALFTDAVILRERFCGLTKSIIAVRRTDGVPP